MSRADEMVLELDLPHKIPVLVPEGWSHEDVMDNFENIRYSIDILNSDEVAAVGEDGHGLPAPLIPNKKRLTWTEKEHRLFLYGLSKYGKGNWNSISKYLLPSKSSCQIASHAQKYFLRQSGSDKKRTSIHDITTKEFIQHLASPLTHQCNSINPPPQNEDLPLEYNIEDVATQEDGDDDHHNGIPPSHAWHVDLIMEESSDEAHFSIVMKNPDQGPPSLVIKEEDQVKVLSIEKQDPSHSHPLGVSRQQSHMNRYDFQPRKFGLTISIQIDEKGLTNTSKQSSCHLYTNNNR